MSYDLSRGGGLKSLIRLDEARRLRESARHLRASAGSYSVNDSHHWVDESYRLANRLEIEAEVLSKSGRNI